jgi:structural maintenance of chromosome 1
MDIDDDGTQRAAVADNFGVEPDFEELDEEAKEVSHICNRSQDHTNVQDGSEEVGRELEAEVTRMRAELEKLNPNTKAVEKYVHHLS